MPRFKKRNFKAKTKKEIAIGLIAFGNYAAGVLIFGQVFGQDKFNLRFFTLGITLFVVFYLASIYLLERTK